MLMMLGWLGSRARPFAAAAPDVELVWDQGEANGAALGWCGQKPNAADAHDAGLVWVP